MDLKSILGAVSAALGVIKTVAKTPGINLLPYVSTVTGAIDTIEFAIDKGKNIADYVADFTATFSDGVPSQDKLDALDAKTAALRAKLHAPLPPKEEGEDE